MGFLFCVRAANEMKMQCERTLDDLFRTKDKNKSEETPDFNFNCEKIYVHWKSLCMHALIQKFHKTHLWFNDVRRMEF